MRGPLFLILWFVLSSALALCGETNEKAGADAPHATVLSDLTFAAVDGTDLKLNLYLPVGVKNPPLVVYIHGGGWRGGSRNESMLQWLTAHGYALASVDYRFSNVAHFPAQIHDCKGAIRWLRANADKYGYNAKTIVICGSSAGGHLSVLLGTTAGNKELEGTVGGNAEVSSAVQGILDFYGPTDFVLRAKDQPKETDAPGGKVYSLLGKAVLSDPEFAKLASGAYHVSKDSPPLLIFHGTADKVVLINQSQRLQQAYEALKLSVRMVPVPDAGHGGPGFITPQTKPVILEFLAAIYATAQP